jgi:leucyl-tRNA synthetase
MEKYNPKKIESKWQEIWDESGVYKDYDKAKKFYALDMFPYVSGVGLHVGHPKGYIATDVISRFKMLQGYSVLHPMGWDAFGLPTENYAIKNKINPEIVVKENIKTFKKQLSQFGFTYDWDREINTTDPEFYKWTQWIFLKIFEKGLAYESNEPINWCPSCKTGLANEDLEKGLCERCGTQVVQKRIRQWVLKMTDYADRLLYDLDSEDLDWEELIKEQQRNWIGKSQGAQFGMPIVIASEAKQSRDGIAASPTTPRNDTFIEVYTTRLDTVYGMTYAVVAPEHPIIEKLKDKIENYSEIEKYIIKSQNKTELERTDLQKDKTGVELKGIKVINPFNNEEIPLYVADYVLGFYGTGAVMAVPAHDERDWEFARKYNLPIKRVIIPPNKVYGVPREVSDKEIKKVLTILRSGNYLNYFFNFNSYEFSCYYPWEDNVVLIDDEFFKLLGIDKPKFFGSPYTQYAKIDCYVCDGFLDKSSSFSNLNSKEAREKMTKWLEKNNIGKKKVNYKMRDWVFSRQRYWGEPIPIIHCEKCGAVAVPKKDLPLKLPPVKSYEPTGTGESPLANIKEWVNVKCPKCGGPGKRETNTMPQWAGSSWYFLRYIDPKNSKALIDKKEEKEWMPVDLYVGGAEHATRHLLYARFWHKFLYDIGAVSTKEPFKKLVHVGLIDGEDGRKMSKRWGNVVNPDDVISEFGADSMRLYEMFMGPFSQNVAWSTAGVSGMRRFLDKVWKFSYYADLSESSTGEISYLINKTIKKVGEDVENFRFNTAISSMMIFINKLYETPEELKQSKSDAKRKIGQLKDNPFGLAQWISKDDFEKFIKLLCPFAPHIAEEIWKEKFGHKESIFKEDWPNYDPKMIKDEEIELVVQINGKLRDRIKVSADISEEEAKKLVMKSEKIERFIAGKEIKKIIFVKGKIINLVI